MISSRSFLLLWVGLLSPALLLSSCSPKKTAQQQMPPPEVLVTEVKQEDIPIYHEFVGTLAGSVNASIQARVSGYLISQNYKEGSLLNKGDLLFAIDPRPFQAALAKAKAALAEAEASERQTKLAAERNLDLFKRKAVSEQERDNAVQANLAAKAQAEAQRAQLDQATLDLEFTKITAPVEGIAGIAKAQVGDLVGPSTGVLTTVSTVDPIKAYFTVSEQAYVEYMKRYADPSKRSEHEKQLNIELILADGSMFPEKGELFATDREVDVRTGAIRIAALFPNPGNVLRPGQFARVKVRSEMKQGALLVPQRAVTEMQGTYQIAVVGSDNKVSVRSVKAGERIGTMWVINEGLSPGDRVIVEGTQKARDGASVAPKPWTPPSQEKSAAGKQ
ncbi:efflux RND transporter periplasmic adaptor subunit [Verrucomicrobiota bacterium sgz303538]